MKKGSILAAYATYKELYNKEQYKSSYQILAEFIKYIIKEEGLYEFGVAEIKNHLNKVFEFNLPIAVIQSSLRGIESITRANKRYFVKKEEKEEIEENDDFSIYFKEAEEKNHVIINDLIAFKENREDKKLTNDEKIVLVNDFMTYLFDESSGNSNSEIISSYIMYNSGDKDFNDQLGTIRSGCILYLGLNLNIDNIGSLSEELTLFLDMEILFDIIGYNGIVFQELALDMIKLIQEANKKTKYIKLRYFEETKNEIDDFFLKAEEIVIGKTLMKDNVAMKSITDGCKNSSDVLDKKSDFYSKLKFMYLIKIDERKDYYLDNDIEANLEGIKVNNNYEQSNKFISHINKLRNNKNYNDYYSSKYLFITETGKTLELSKEMTISIKREKNISEKITTFAVNMSFMTNILWYKLNKGFGAKEFPKNLDAVVKAKIVLSNLISQNLSKNYDKYKEDYDKGIITDQQLIARIVCLRDKASRPEDINIENLEESLNFDETHIARYIEERDWQRSCIKSKDERIKQIENDLLKIQDESTDKIGVLERAIKEQSATGIELQETVNQQKLFIEKQKQDTESKNKLIEQLLQERDERIKKIERVKSIFKFLKKLLFRIASYILLLFILYKLAEIIGINLFNNFFGYMSIAGVIINLLAYIKKDLIK